MGFNCPLMGELIKSLLQQLKQDKISPLYYFMMIEGLTPSELAARAGISTRRVKKHLTPRGFQKISVAGLKRNAGIFNIPVANMFQIINTVEDRHWNVGFRTALNDSKSFLISQGSTGNPLVVETKIIKNPKCARYLSII